MDCFTRLYRLSDRRLKQLKEEKKVYKFLELSVPECPLDIAAYVFERQRYTNKMSRRAYEAGMCGGVRIATQQMDDIDEMNRILFKDFDEREERTNLCPHIRPALKKVCEKVKERHVGGHP